MSGFSPLQMADANYFRHLGCWRHFAAESQVGAKRTLRSRTAVTLWVARHFYVFFPRFGLYSCTTTAGAETATGRTSTRTADKAVTLNRNSHELGRVVTILHAF
jgi:hypothetical protein